MTSLRVLCCRMEGETERCERRILFLWSIPRFLFPQFLDASRYKPTTFVPPSPGPAFLTVTDYTTPPPPPFISPAKLSCFRHLGFVGAGVGSCLENDGDLDWKKQDLEHLVSLSLSCLAITPCLLEVRGGSCSIRSYGEPCSSWPPCAKRGFQTNTVSRRCREMVCARACARERARAWMGDGEVK